jgi:hypothetical protein
VVVTTQLGHVTRIATGVDLATTRRPMLASDRFRVGSITKTFVAALVLQLAEPHRLSLDDSVERWLPGLVPKGAAISVRQLLLHTSALYDYAADPATFQPFATNPGYAWEPHGLVAIANRHAPNFAPGKGWGYSNTNYVLPGMIVEDGDRRARRGRARAAHLPAPRPGGDQLRRRRPFSATVRADGGPRASPTATPQSTGKRSTPATSIRLGATPISAERGGTRAHDRGGS